MTIIKSKNFILRPIRISDSEAYFRMMQDKESKKGFMAVPETLGEVKKEIKEKIKQYKKKKPSGEAFVIEIDGEFAGDIEINGLNKEHFEHKGNIGYCIHPDYRGRGIATEALKLITSYAFKKYKLKRIEGWCRTFNKGSAKVLEKAGYKLEGILRKNKCKDGEYLDDMVWAKVR